MGQEDGGAQAVREADESGAADESGVPDTGALLDRLAGVRAILARERDAAPALCHELCSLAQEERLARVAADPRFHTFGLCELLIASAAALGAEAPGNAPAPPAVPAVPALPAVPAEAGHMAAVALAAADRLDPAIHPAPVVHDLKARAWAAIGEARRAGGELAGAEEALAAAAACLAHGTGDLLVDACLLEFEAAVRADQGRPGEADALLRQAAARYAQVNEPALEGRAMARRDALRRAGLSTPGTGHPVFGTRR